jgi:hypothetical protein
MELARVMSRRRLAATVVFASVAGEEQGLYGASHMAEQFKAASARIQGVFTNDIVGGSTVGYGTRDVRTVRLFAEGVPTSETPMRVPSVARSAVRTTRRGVSWCALCGMWVTTTPWVWADICGSPTHKAKAGRLFGRTDFTRSLPDVVPAEQVDATGAGGRSGKPTPPRLGLADTPPAPLALLIGPGIIWCLRRRSRSRARRVLSGGMTDWPVSEQAEERCRMTAF